MGWWGDWFQHLAVATIGETREEGEPVWIKIGDRSIEIEPTPVPSVKGASSSRDVALVRRNEQLWVIVPSTLTWIFGLIMAVGMPTVVVAAVISYCRAGLPLNNLGWEHLLGILAGIVFIIGFGIMMPRWGLILLTHRVRFDKVKGEVSFHWLFRKRHSFRLRDVWAVQTVYAGSYSAGRGRFKAWQLNLVLRSFKHRRVNITTCGGREWIIEAGRELAGFLQAPFAQQIGGGELESRESGECDSAWPEWVACERNTRLQARGNRRLTLQPVYVNAGPSQRGLGRSLAQLWNGPACAMVELARNPEAEDQLVVRARPGGLPDLLRFGARNTWPLTEVQAVSLELCSQLPEAGGKVLPPYLCKLALELRDPREPTLVLAPYAELAWAHTAAEQLARFLQVPLFDRI